MYISSLFQQPNVSKIDLLDESPFENEWSKLEESILNNKKKDESITSVNENSLLKNMEWDNIFVMKDYKNESKFEINKIQELNKEIELQKLIHPLDTEFEFYATKKIEELENLLGNNKKIKDNNLVTRPNNFVLNYGGGASNDSIVKGKNNDIEFLINGVKTGGKTFLIDES